MKVLLVGNYLLDRQESMLRLASVLFAGLSAEGIEMELVRPPGIFGRMVPASDRFAGARKWLGYLDKFAIFPFLLKRRAKCCDLVHICDHSNAPYTAFLGAIPSLVTCCDLLAIRSARGEFPENPTRASGRLLQRIILAGLNRAKAITCISEASRTDALRLTSLDPSAVSVTLLGLNYPYSPRPGKTPRNYLLHVGGDHWYKNRKGVLAIYRELRMLMGERAPGLIMVGPPLQDPPPGVECRSEVSNEELCSLYSDAQLLLFPSLEEGFGWPLIEAQASGCRVVTRRKAPMTEVAGESAIYLDDARDACAGAQLVAKALQEPLEQRTERITKGIDNAAKFSAQEMVREYIALYRSLIQGEGSSRRPA